MLITFNWMFLHFGKKIPKHKCPSAQTAYKADPIISDDRTFIHLSAKNPQIFLGLLEKLIETKYFSIT